MHWVVNQQPYHSPLRFDDGFEGEGSSYFYGTEQTQQGDLRLDADGRAELRVPLDEHGNARGGIRNAYVDVPVKKYGVRNEGAVPPIQNAHPFVAVRGEAAQNQLCGLAGYEMAFSQADLKKLYKDKKDYVRRVERSIDEATKQGWFLPVYRSTVLADAAAVTFQ